MPKKSNVVKVQNWPVHYRTGLERALESTRRHNRRRKRLKWGVDMLRGVCASWGRLLFWSREQAWYEATMPIELMLTPERVEAFVTDLIVCGNKPATIRHRIMGLERMLAALTPKCDRDWLNAIKYRFSKTGDRAEKRSRLQFTNVLIRFAASLAESADELAEIDPIQGAVLYRVALQIMWLSYQPMRLKNFQQLTLGREVIPIEGRQWRSDIPASATKRGNAYDPVLPARLVKHLEHYRFLHLPKLGGDAEAGPLWLTVKGQRQSARSIYYYVCRHTEKRFGRSMCPHLFRDAVMTTVATQMPENVRMGMHLVGNRDQDCMATHYDQSQRATADAKFNAAIDAWEDAA